MLRSLIVPASLILVVLAGCSTAQHRPTTGVSNPQAGAAATGAQAAPPATGMNRFFPGLAARESSADPKTKAASKPPRTGLFAGAPARAESVAKASTQPPGTEKKVFAPIAWIESRWAARVNAAKSAAAAKSATPTTASLTKGPEPEPLARSIAVAVYPDDPPTPTGRRPSARRSPPAPETPAGEPTADAAAGPRDADARRAGADLEDEPRAEPTSPAPAPDASTDRPEGVEEAGVSPFAAPEPPHLPPAEVASTPTSAPVAAPARPEPHRHLLPAAPHFHLHIHTGPSAADRARTFKLPPLGLPPDLPPPMFLRSYYGLDPAPNSTPIAAPRPVQAPTAPAPPVATAPPVSAPPVSASPVSASPVPVPSVATTAAPAPPAEPEAPPSPATSLAPSPPQAAPGPPAAGRPTWAEWQARIRSTEPPGR